jgi:DNA polymerase V
MANRLAKKHKHKTSCVLILDTERKIISALQHTPVEDIWGVGRQYARKLKEEWGIYDALQLRNVSEEFATTHLGGVVGTRLVRELKAKPSKVMEDELVNKKMIATTRMFGSPVDNINDIKEAIATYTSRAAEKLRRQFSAAKTVSIFVVTKEQNHRINFGNWRENGTLTEHATLPTATSHTHELIKPAMALVDKIFQKGKLYKKAGVMLSGIVPDQSIQGNLFVPENKNCERKLMEMIDNINFSQRDDVLKFAASGTKRDWKMRQELRSPRYTTRWEELFKVQ